MKHTVLWTSTAEQHLAKIWMDQRDRKAVTSAAHSIDKILTWAPASKGESRKENARVTFVPPLGVGFQVTGDSPGVHVFAVWSYEKGA